MYKVILVYSKGILEEERADYPEAIKMYKQSIELNHYSIDSYTRLAYLYHKLGQNEDAILILEEGKKQLDALCVQNKGMRQINSISMMHGYIAHQI
jgi:tetratricopeptide (TPR) repeat protein